MRWTLEREREESSEKNKKWRKKPRLQFVHSLCCASKTMVSSSSSYPRPRRGGVGVGALGKSSSSSAQPLSLRDVEREIEDVFETHSVAEIREVREDVF